VPLLSSGLIGGGGGCFSCYYFLTCRFDSGTPFDDPGVSVSIESKFSRDFLGASGSVLP
jgi:hypothetical protein